MTKTYEERGYEINGNSYIINTNFKKTIYKYDIVMETKFGHSYVDSFITLKEAEDYLKEIEKGEVNEI